MLSEYIGVIFALLLLEAVLSFDNAAILAAMVRKLPPADRRKALFYGLFGAYALRIGVIAIASWLIDNQWVKLIGGGYLIFLCVKHFYSLMRHGGDAHAHHIEGNPSNGFLVKLGVPVLIATIIQIELMDLAFALDQVLAAVAFVETYTETVAFLGMEMEVRFVLIVIASLIGIAMLRVASTYIVKVMDWLPVLEHMAFIAVGYVGVKLTLTYPGFNGGYHIPNPVSIAVTIALFAVPVLIKLIFKWPKSQPGQHELPEH